MSQPEVAPAAVVRAYLDALNRGSADEIAACVSEDFINEHTSTLGESVTGRAAYRQRLGGFLAGFSNLRYEIEQVIADGDNVAVAYRMSADWHAPGAAERPFTIRGMFRFVVRNGLIAHRVDYWDSADFRRQVQGDSAQPKR